MFHFTGPFEQHFLVASMLTEMTQIYETNVIFCNILFLPNTAEDNADEC